MALLRDTSQEQALHDEVEALGKRFRTVLDLSPVAMWITDGDHVAFANRAAFELFGVRPGDHLVGRSVFTLLRPNPHAALREQMVTAVAGAAPPVVAGSIAVRRRLARGRDRRRRAARPRPQRHADGHHRRHAAPAAGARADAPPRGTAPPLGQRGGGARRSDGASRANLHDELGQRLTALKMELSSLASAKARAPTRRASPTCWR
ncbi:MAG: PAS domain-containing protein [Betaproteobacteria bacterium]|nr:PAS domain-containing protein [Betaproteobacteria bacterium]